MSGATKLLYRALSIADILTCSGLISGVITSSITAATGRRSDIACKVFGLLMTCAPGTSAILILLLNLDRFICITRPLQYPSIVTRWKSAVAIAIAIPYISGFTTLFVLIHDRNLSVIREHKSLYVCKVAFSEPSFLPYTLLMFSSNMWLVAVILIAMYSKIIMISRHHIARMNEHQKIANRVLRTNGNAALADEQDQIRSAAQHFDPSIVRAFRQNIRTLRTPLLITGGYLISWIPFSVVEVYISVSGATYLLDGFLYKSVASAAAMNSSANLFVYFLSRKDLRRAAKWVVLCRREN
ncbi:alpha-1A adrenergic receptor-like [Lytechinus variegatus]|uniref:alpha-1A adrenergic receptor-like n=1 Tax=Lytechinus variegatus TaxID=7654 RepID=UPI001BB263AF|nr:alpha-1A adrenergic receptor-like [Lytechinus variegatus]